MATTSYIASGIDDKTQNPVALLPQEIESRVGLRFSDIGSAIDVPVQMDTEDAQDVSIDFAELMDDPTELCDLFEAEKVGRSFWLTVAMAYAKQNRMDTAIEMLVKGLAAIQGGPKEKLSMQTALCWLYLWKSREAPRVAPDGQMASEAKTKDYYLRQSTMALNDATRINPAFPPLFMARGVLALLKASLQPPSKSPVIGNIDSDKLDLLRNALRSFDDAIRVSQGKNMLAVLGKARTLFSLNKFPEALEIYQQVVTKMPELVDPDARIGLGACLWMLGHKDDARTAWERSLEVNPNSNIANILLGLYYLDKSGQHPTTSKEFIENYKKAMMVYTQKAFKLDKNPPLTCATFAGYFLTRKNLANVDTLAHKAISYTDVNAVASDGWYLLARKEHYENNIDRAADYYRRADEARGGAERGYIPAKFGSAQISVLKTNLGESKFKLEKMLQNSRNIEAQTLLGTIYAEEVFMSQYATPAEDKSAEHKKAVNLLESVRLAWKNPQKQVIPDASVLLNLARLYETEQPEKSLQCLQQIEQLEYAAIPEDHKPKESEAVEEMKKTIHENLPPQLLNNMGAFHYHAEKWDQAKDMFQAALNACVKADEQQEGTDTEALVTTISFNLGRTYEASGLLDDAKKVYEGLLSRHVDYTDARARLAYIALKQNPSGEGPKTVSKLYQDSGNELEVRALYGWYLGRVHGKKRLSASHINEDPEFRHYKHTLQHYDKHDRYALIGMGNIYLQTAREMPRSNEQEKAKRSSYYSKAVEFFDKALQLDSKNAYAAQGIAIAMIEDKKDFKGALTVFMQIRETIKDASVYVNLGHLFAELRQWSKAIEHYEAALNKSGGSDATIIACLGRTWLSKGRQEKDLNSYKEALKYAKKALEIQPEQIHFKFNVAFVQTQLASAIKDMSETQRTVAELMLAASGLEAAIETLDEIAQHPNPPYPKSYIEGRANMSRNTMRKQLERSVASQKEYEEKNAEKVREAMEIRARELRAREEKKRMEEEAREARKRKMEEERRKIAEHDRELAEQRKREEMERDEAEMTVDSETGERVKRKSKKKAAPRRKRRDDDESGGESEDGEKKKKRRSRKKSVQSGSEDEEKPKTKRRRLEKKGDKAAFKPSNDKFKSAEVVVDSDEDADLFGGGGGGSDDGFGSDAGKGGGSSPLSDHRAGGAGSDEEEEVIAKPRARASRRVMDSDDEDMDEEMKDADSLEAAEGGADIPAGTNSANDIHDRAAIDPLASSSSKTLEQVSSPGGDEGGGGIAEGAEGGNQNDDVAIASGSADVDAPSPGPSGLVVGEVNAVSPVRDREPDAISSGDEPMGDADRMHDGLDDAEEKEGDVDR